MARIHDNRDLSERDSEEAAFEARLLAHDRFCIPGLACNGPGQQPRFARSQRLSRYGTDMHNFYYPKRWVRRLK